MVPAGAVGRPVRERGAPRTACARSRSRRRAATSSTATASVLVTTRIAPVVQIIPTQLPESELRAAEEYRTALSAAERVRLAADDRLRAFDQRLKQKDRRPTRSERRDRRELARAARTAAPVALPPIPEGVQPLRLYRRLGRVVAALAEDDPPARRSRRSPRRRTRNVTIRTDVPRDAVRLPARAPGALPGRRGREALPARLPAHDAGGAAVRHGQRDHAGASSRSASYRGVAPGHAHRPERPRVAATTATCAARTATRAWSSTRSAAATTRGGSRVREPDAGPAAAADARPRPAEGGRRRDPARRSAPPTPTPTRPRPARSWRWTRATARSCALGSCPSFDANVFAKPISQKRYDELTSQANGAPLLNRAIAATYPTGSTFKPVTAIGDAGAGVDHARARRSSTTASSSSARRSTRTPSGASFGALHMSDALKVSSDVFFFKLGAGPTRGARSSSAGRSRLGFGRRTGIDLPGEFAGLVPDRRWRDDGYEKYLACAKKEHVHARTTAGAVQVRRHRAPVDGRATTSTSPSARATCRPRRCSSPSPTRRSPTAARSSRPHLGQGDRGRRRRAVQEIRTPARARTSRSTRATARSIIDGLRGAATRARRHVGRRLQGLPATRSTARPAPPSAAPNPDQAWYACFVTDARRAPIVVVVTIEQGGFGAETAAPAARLILSQWFDLNDTQFHAGSSADAMSATPDHPAGLRAAAPARPAGVAAAPGPAAAAGDARPRRLLADRAQRRDAERHPRPAALLRLPPGDLRRRRPRAHVRRLAAGLLAAARAALPALRAADRARCWSCSARQGDARRQVVDPAAVLQLPAVRARQGAARGRAVGLPRRPHAPDGPPHDGADHAARR